MSKHAFIEAYRTVIVREYPWARDQAKLERFMAACASTLAGETADWNHVGPAVTEAYRAIGGKGTPTLKALRALL